MWIRLFENEVTLLQGLLKDSRTKEAQSLLHRLQQHVEDEHRPATESYRRTARKGLSDDEWDIDEDALVAFVDKQGAYVMSWRWICRHDGEDGPFADCPDCGCIWGLNELKPIQDLYQRVAAGEIMPAGECPDCGTLCHENVEGQRHY